MGRSVAGATGVGGLRGVMGQRTSEAGVFRRVSSQRVEGVEAFEAVWRRDGYRPCEPRSESPGAQCWFG